MDLQSELARERRARLAAERLLTLRQQELHEANSKLGQHANALTEEIVEKREEAIELRDTADQALHNLEIAKSEVHIAKRRLWASIETIEDGFAVFDKDNKLIIANSAYLRAFDGLESVQPGVSYEELVLYMVEEGIANLAGMRPMDWVDKMLDRWAAPQPRPETIELWDGTHIKLVDRRSDDGDTVSLALNITDQIRYQRKLKQASHRAQAANRAKSAFLARMSHELRTPMNGVLGMAELMSDTELDEEQQLYVATIKSSSEALLLLINDVLDFSKMEAARLELKEAPFDLEQIALAVTRLFDSTRREKGIDIVLSYDMFLPAEFFGDGGRIRQVLTNLIGNAVKFTLEGHVKVSIGGQVVDDKMALRIDVSDTGIGIAEDKIAYVFGEFNQVEDEKNRAFEGTGLGLAICKQIAELMDGTIQVSSVESKGSTFSLLVDLPVQAGVEVPPPSAPIWIKRVVNGSEHSAITSQIAEQLSQLGVPALQTCPDAGDLAGDDLVVVDVQSSDFDRLSTLLSTFEANAMPKVLAVSDVKEICEINGIQHETLTRPFARSDLMDALYRVPEPVALEEVDDLAAPEMPVAPVKTDFEHASRDIVQPQEADNSTAATPNEEASPPAKAPLRKMRVLAAEDNKTNRLVMSKLLKTLNIELKFAENGQEAVELWQDFRPDLIFMDISMPIMDGKEATQTIRAQAAENREPHTPIVAVTAHAMDGDKEDILAAGLDHYLTKPLKKQAIFDRIRVALPDDIEPVFQDVKPDKTDEVDKVKAESPSDAPIVAADIEEEGAAEPDATKVATLADTTPVELKTTASERLKHLSDALGSNPVTTPASPALEQAQDMWKSLSEAEPTSLTPVMRT